MVCRRVVRSQAQMFGGTSRNAEQLWSNIAGLNRHFQSEFDRIYRKRFVMKRTAEINLSPKSTRFIRFQSNEVTIPLFGTTLLVCRLAVLVMCRRSGCHRIANQRAVKGIAFQRVVAACAALVGHGDDAFRGGLAKSQLPAILRRNAHLRHGRTRMDLLWMLLLW